MADDTMKTSRAIDALKDPSFQAFADALVDRVSAIVGNHQLRVMDALAQLEANQTAFNHPLGALVAKQDLITEHLQRQDTTLDAVSTGLTVLRTEFQATGESLSQWRIEVDETLNDFRQSRQRSIQQIQELRGGLEESKADRKAIRREQQARDKATAKQLNELSSSIEKLRVQYVELAKNIDGRLTQLLDRTAAAARAEGQAEGHDEERADPGSG